VLFKFCKRQLLRADVDRAVRVNLDDNKPSPGFDCGCDLQLQLPRAATTTGHLRIFVLRLGDQLLLAESLQTASIAPLACAS
jgi:hypothetical protein